MPKSRDLSTPPGDFDGAEGAAAWDRRAFVRTIAVAALAVQVLPLAARAGDSPGRGGGADDDLVIHSTPGLFFHVHTLEVPRAVLRTPPRQGVRLSSSKALFHTHEIALSQGQLMSIRQGGTVTAKRSSHRFVIALAKGQGHARA